MTFVSVSYYQLNCKVPIGKINLGCVVRAILKLYFDCFSKIEIKIRVPRAFCNSKILFHKISVRSNTVLYNLGPFIILEPIAPFLFKVEALLQETLSKMSVAESSPNQTLMLRLNM